MLSKLKSAAPVALITLGVVILVKMFAPGLSAKMAAWPVVGILFR